MSAATSAFLGRPVGAPERLQKAKRGRGSSGPVSAAPCVTEGPERACLASTQLTKSSSGNGFFWKPSWLSSQHAS